MRGSTTDSNYNSWASPFTRRLCECTLLFLSQCLPYFNNPIRRNPLKVVVWETRECPARAVGTIPRPGAAMLFVVWISIGQTGLWLAK